MELHNGCLKRPWRKYWNISGMCMHKKGWRKYIQIQGKFITFMQYKYLSIDKWQLHTIGFSVGKTKEKTVHLLERIQDHEMSLYRSKELCSYVFLFKVHHSSPIKYKQDSIGILKTFFFPASMYNFHSTKNINDKWPDKNHIVSEYLPVMNRCSVKINMLFPHFTTKIEVVFFFSF